MSGAVTGSIEDMLERSIAACDLTNARDAWFIRRLHASALAKAARQPMMLWGTPVIEGNVIKDPRGNWWIVNRRGELVEADNAYCEQLTARVEAPR